MSSYIGRHAELYDLFYAEKAYADEARFIDAQLKQVGVRANADLLELACGTARHAIEFARLGYCVTGVDYSRDLLNRARAAVAESGQSVELCAQDMRSLDLGERRFDVVTCLFDSIGYVLTNDAIAQTLRNIANHLIPGGWAVLEFWHAAAMLRSYDPVRVRRWETATGKLLRISETSLDVAQQTSTVSYSVYEFQNDRTYTSFSETQRNRYFLQQEMHAYLTDAGLQPRYWYAGFSTERKIDENCWHIVVMAMKQNEGRNLAYTR